MTQALLHEEAPGVTRVDLHWKGDAGRIAVYLVADGDELALIDTGPESTFDTLLAALAAAGRDPSELTRVLVTHIHLDHAGAAGALLERAPRATLHVHPIGAPHLADPERLYASASMLFGEQMDALWGGMCPVPAERIVALEDGGRVPVGGRTLVAVETPGHAWHHHAFHDPDAGLVFTGDVGGLRLRGLRYVRPPVPPPDIDTDRWVESLEAIRRLRPRRLLLAHFGGVEDPEWHLDDLAGRLQAYTKWVSELMGFGADPGRLTDAFRRKCEAEVRAAAGSPEVARLYEEAVPYDQMAMAMLRFLRARAGRTGAGR